MKRRTLPGAAFIWRGKQQKYFRKSDKEVVKNVARSSAGAFGIAGSDVLIENPCPGIAVSQIGPIQNERHQPLRFCTATINDARKIANVQSKLASCEPVVVATSYPNTAKRLLGRLGITPVVPDNCIQSGGIEALPEQYPEVDIIFELVQSGDSLSANGLKMLEDKILEINLLKVERPNQSKLSYNGG